MQASTIEFVANRKYLNLATEFSLFDAILSWTLAEARRRQLDLNDWGQLRSLLEADNCTILGAVRFLAMSQAEFARAIAKTSSTIRQPLSSTVSSLATAGSNSDLESAGQETGGANNNLSQAASEAPTRLVDKINTSDPNSLLRDAEQRSIFLNLALGDVAKLPASINPVTQKRQAPPEHFTLRRFRSGSTSPTLVTTTTTTRSIKSISSKFQCLSENVFIVGLTIPIRLDASSYANRTPKFECHLKFTTKATATATSPQPTSGVNSDLAASMQQQDSSASLNSTLLMDTIDESLNISIARDKDCLVRLKRPILIRMGTVNELTLTFQTYALDEDIVALRTPKLRSATFSEQTDGENISWLFFKTPGIEFSELHYYY